MFRPVERLGLWVWYWDSRYLDVARRLGAYLLVKAADGNRAWVQWRPARQAAADAGIACYPWVYTYGGTGEAAVIGELAASTPLVLLDPEVEFENRPSASQSVFVDEILAAVRNTSVTLGAATWARPSAHPGYNFAELARAVQLWFPMVAWPVWDPPDWDTWLAEWTIQQQHVGFPGEAIPWLPSDQVLPADLVGSVRDAIRRFGGASIWAAHTLTNGQISALADVMTPEPTPTVKTALDELWAVAQALRVEGNPGAADQIEAPIVRIKGLVGL